MLTLRSCARSAPRFLSQVSSKAIKSRPALLRNSPILSTSWRQASTPKALASFHTSIARRDAASELVATNLQSELDYEKEQGIAEDGQAPEYSQNIKDYLENSAFQLVDTPGSEEFRLVREFEDEKITVTFTINDMLAEDPDERQFDDQAMYDDEEIDADEIAGGQSGGANTKGAINQGTKSDGNFKVAPEDQVAPADRPELEDEYNEEAPAAYPSRTSIKIERPGKGAVAIDAIAENGNIFVENVFYFPDAKLADPEAVELDFARRSMYTGPKFNGLDENLQQSIESYLAERGINERMAVFVPDYIDYKESQEYVRWLNNMRNFFS